MSMPFCRETVGFGRVSLLAASLALLGVFLPGPAASAADTTQDFSADFPEPPPFAFVQNGSDPGPTGNPNGWDGNSLQLAAEVADQSNFVHLGAACEEPFESVTITFEFRISPGNNTGADGIGLAYLNSGEFGSTTDEPFSGWGLAEEPNLAGSFGVGFDTWNNGPSDGGENSVSLHSNGQLFESVPIDGEVISTFENDKVHTATIIVESGGNGALVTVAITDGENEIVPFQDALVPGLAPYVGRAAFGARTAAANALHEIDNIQVTVVPVGGGGPCTLSEGFEELPAVQAPALLGGTPFSSAQLAGSPGPKLLPENPGDVGPAPGFLRLATQVTNQNNTMAFDQTSVRGAHITAGFAMRGLDQNEELGQADGFSFLLVPTELYGDDGPLPHAVGEEPNLDGAFGVGFDTFDNGEGGANHISLHYDGAQVSANVFLAPEDLDLVNGEFNDFVVDVEQVEGGSNVTVIITDGTDGSVHVPFADVHIAGMDLAGTRVAFAARTGGAADHYDLDDVHVEFHGTLPQDIEDLMQKVRDLGLSPGIENSLLVMLNVAYKSAMSANSEVRQNTFNNLRAFMNHVSALSGKKMDEQDADALMDGAAGLINHFGGGG